MVYIKNVFTQNIQIDTASGDITSGQKVRSSAFHGVSVHLPRCNKLQNL